MQAVKKGLNTTVIGFIFGLFELTIVLVSPIYGSCVSDATLLSLP